MMLLRAGALAVCFVTSLLSRTALSLDNGLGLTP
jgi:hypothetical protein